MLLMYSANSQHTMILRSCTVSQITWAENFDDNKSETINTWEEMAFLLQSWDLSSIWLNQNSVSVF